MTSGHSARRLNGQRETREPESPYLNIRNVSLSYTFPRRWAQAIDLSSIQLFGSVENLHLFTHRSGMDPQYNFSGTSYNSYSPARTMSFGVNLQF